MDQFSRTELLVGAEGIERLRNSRVAVFGIGGVGGYVVEALARSGVGTLDLIDNDKVDVAKKRVLDINPAAVVNTYRTFFVPETAADFDFHAYDYVVDAIDTVTGKIQLIVQADSACTPVISCMGAGNKMDPTAFRVADIYQTSVCPLAKVMRRELKKRGIRKLKVVYSEEVPIEVKAAAETEKKRIPGSNAFVPSVAGLIMAGEVVRELLARA